MLLKRVWLTERDKLRSLNAEWRMTDSRSREKSLRELEFNNLNIHQYLKLNHGIDSEHLKYSARKLYGVLWCFCGFRGAYQRHRIVYAQHRIWIGLVSPIPDLQKMTRSDPIPILSIDLMHASLVGVDRYVFFRADTDYYRSSRPITDILNRYTCLV